MKEVNDVSKINNQTGGDGGLSLLSAHPLTVVKQGKEKSAKLLHIHRATVVHVVPNLVIRVIAIGANNLHHTMIHS